MSTAAQARTLRCPVCQTDARYVFTSKHKRDIYECRYAPCGHFFTPILRDDQGICLRDEDIERESEESLAQFEERNVRLLNLFNRLLADTPRPLRFLDFGAGNAHISRTFKRMLKDDAIIYCLEPNPLCEGFYPKHQLVQVKSIDDIPEQIHFVYMIEVIEHLDDPISVLKRLRKSLAPNGMIFISTPLGRRHERLTNAFETPSHVHFFTPASLNITLMSAGFSEMRFGFYPEMYLQPRRLVGQAKTAVKRLIAERFNAASSLGHLVGVTKPVSAAV